MTDGQAGLVDQGSVQEAATMTGASNGLPATAPSSLLWTGLVFTVAFAIVVQDGERWVTSLPSYTVTLDWVPRRNRLAIEGRELR